MSSSGITSDVCASYVEVNYVGRDTNRFIITLLQKIAGFILEAKGEVRCTVQVEGEDDSFEFYTVSKGQLWVQYGHLVRDAEKRICQDDVMQQS